MEAKFKKAFEELTNLRNEYTVFEFFDVPYLPSVTYGQWESDADLRARFWNAIDEFIWADSTKDELISTYKGKVTESNFEDFVQKTITFLEAALAEMIELDPERFADFYGA